MAIVWALLSALSYGLADLSAREVSKTEGTTRTLLYLNGIGTPIVLVVLFLSQGAGNWTVLFSWVGLGMVGLAFLHNIVSVLFYRAMVIGPLLIVSPITSCFSAVTLGLSILSGERPTLIQLMGSAFVLIGIFLAVMDFNQPQSAQPLEKNFVGIFYALAAAFFLGIEMWSFRFFVPVLGEVMTSAIIRFGALICMSLFFLVRGLTPRLNSSASWRWILPLAFCDTFAMLFYIFGISSGLTSIVSVITSLYSVIVVILGYIFWRERISSVQQVGIGLAFVGIACVNL